jgi:hypothetical protein
LLLRTLALILLPHSQQQGDTMSQFPENDNTRVIDALVEAYNNSDADGFADFFAEDAIIYDPANVPAQVGREAIRAHYRAAFAKHPQNRTRVLGRLAVGPYVVDHEQVRRSPDHEPFEVIAINQVQNGQVVRLDMLRS